MAFSFSQAIPGVFVSFALTKLSDFFPEVPSMFDFSSRKTEIADVNTAVGIAMVESSGTIQNVQYSFGFKQWALWSYAVLLADP